jgi:hypothetical protein
VVWSFVYVALCRLLQLVALLGRSERSKELEILVLRHELAIPAPAAAASAVSTRGSGNPGGGRAGAAAEACDRLQNWHSNPSRPQRGSDPGPRTPKLFPCKLAAFEGRRRGT